GDPLVIPALNRDGDILSDLVLPLFGSIAGSESLLVAFEEDYEPKALMAEAAHGTAPSLRGKNVANPVAMILAGAALLAYGVERARGRECTTVRTSGGHRVEGIGDREQPRSFGNLRSTSAGRIAAAVPALVVVQDVRQGVSRWSNRADQFRACGRVRADLGKL